MRSRMMCTSDRTVYSSNYSLARLILIEVIKLLFIPSHFKNKCIGCGNNKLFDRHSSILRLLDNYSVNKLFKLLYTSLRITVEVRLDVIYQYIARQIIVDCTKSTHTCSAKSILVQRDAVTSNGVWRHICCNHLFIQKAKHYCSLYNSNSIIPD